MQVPGVLTLLWDALTGDCLGSVAFEVAAAALLCTLTAAPDAADARSRIVAQMRDKPRGWVTLVRETSSAEARADAVATALLTMQPYAVDVSHIPVRMCVCVCCDLLCDVWSSVLLPPPVCVCESKSCSHSRQPSFQTRT